jgi:hypothetical protein
VHLLDIQVRNAFIIGNTFVLGNTFIIENTEDACSASPGHSSEEHIYYREHILL